MLHIFQMGYRPVINTSKVGFLRFISYPVSVSYNVNVSSRGGVTQGSRPKDTKKSEAKDSPSEDRSSQGQGPRTQAQVFSKKSDLKRKSLQKYFSGDLQNFNNSKNTAVLEPRTGQFSRT